MKTYEGRREGHAVLVSVNGHPLNPRLDLWNHSPTGFEWGYGGSGPAQLALALLADHLDDKEQAVALHQLFKSAVVAQLPYRGWSLTTRELDQVLSELRPFGEGQKPSSETAADNGGNVSPNSTASAKFRLGRIVSTPTALSRLTNQDVLTGIQRHQAGDWGNVDSHDRQANDRALVEGTRVLSVYRAANGVKFWIITEADRSATTVLLPEDY